MEAGGLSSVIECGQALEHHGQRDDARRLYEQALNEGTATTAAEAAQLLRLVARTYLHDANYAATVDCATAALAIADLTSDDGARGHAINILAIVEWKQGNLDAAEQLYLLARQSADRSGESRVTNGRFRGGWITRHYGKPEVGVHAVQMELAMRGYLQEPEGSLNKNNWPAPLDDVRAARLRVALRDILSACAAFARPARSP